MLEISERAKNVDEYFFTSRWKDFSSTLERFFKAYEDFLLEEEYFLIEDLLNEVTNVQYNFRELITEQELRDKTLLKSCATPFTSHLTIQRNPMLDDLSSLNEVILWFGSYPKTMVEISCYLAFTKLYQTHRESLHAYIIKHFYQHRDSADDIVQEAFVAVMQQARTTRINNLIAYIVRIVYNKAVDLDDERKRLDYHPPEEKFLPKLIYEPGILESLERKETKQFVRSALKSLPELQLQVIKLRYYEDLKFEEIAQRLNCSEGTVKSRYRYALKKLQRNPKIRELREE